jgi:hypothetical protein
VRGETAGPLEVVTPIIGAQITVVAYDTAVARVLRAYAVYTDARISIPVAESTAVAPLVFAFGGRLEEVIGALVAVVTRILLADKPRAYAEPVLDGFVYTIEVALHDVAVEVAARAEVSVALVASAFVLVVAVLVALTFTPFTTSH